MNSKRDENHSENHKHDLVMPQSRVALVNLLIKIRRGEAGYDMAATFLAKNTKASSGNGV